MSQTVRNKPNSKKTPLTTIVVPVLNEWENVIPLVKRIKTSLKMHPTEVLFVDDSRNNKTVEAVKVAQKKLGTKIFIVRVFHRRGKQNWGGLSGAVADGFKKAKSEQIIVMDGDLQHPPETIPAMIKAAENYDMVVASRYRHGGSASGLSGIIRHLVSRGSTVVTKLFFPLRLRPVSDPMTGFFLVKRNLVELSRLRPKGFKILLEILVSHPEITVSEVPLKFAKRVAGESHGDLKQGLEFLSQLTSLRVASAVRGFYRFPKIIQFGAIGGSVFVFGMILLFIMVEALGIPPLIANAVQLLITFALNYILNKRITWRERDISNTAAQKFLLSRAGTTFINYVLFAWLITLHATIPVFSNTYSLSVNYLAANIIALGAITALNYLISDRWAFAEKTEKKVLRKPVRLPAFKLLALISLLLILVGERYNVPLTFAFVLAIAGLALFAQASVEAWRMLYAYREPDAVDKMKFPLALEPNERFCIIVPARHESAVLGTTLLQLAKQTHPNVEIISVICDDDYETLQAAYDAAALDQRINVIQYPLRPTVKPSKPKQLNYVLSTLKNKNFTVVGVFDAEDTVHPELLRHVDTAFADQSIGVVQGGVQLMNHDTSWYSLHNVLEYYRWFNSAMAYQADKKFMPLGGNTIFIRYDLLRKAGGWPVTLTEDCSLGVVLSTRYRAKTAVYYEPWLATREETPDSIEGLFKQRVRWNQGFYHEWRKGVWHELPSFRQRVLAGYTLATPILLASISTFLIFALLATIFLDAPVLLVMFMYFPLIPVSLLLLINVVFLHDFGKAFDRNIRITDYSRLIVMYFPYQILLNAAAFWSIVRELRGENSWYKTPHTGQHRILPSQPTIKPYAESKIPSKLS